MKESENDCSEMYWFQIVYFTFILHGNIDQKLMN